MGDVRDWLRLTSTRDLLRIRRALLCRYNVPDLWTRDVHTDLYFHSVDVITAELARRKEWSNSDT